MKPLLEMTRDDLTAVADKHMRRARFYQWRAEEYRAAVTANEGL